MRDKAAKVPANDAVPCGALPAVELGWCQRALLHEMSKTSHLLLDVLGDILGREHQHQNLQLGHNSTGRTFSMVNCSMACCATRCQ
jgi:hypothetical protein